MRDTIKQLYVMLKATRRPKGRNARKHHHERISSEIAKIPDCPGHAAICDLKKLGAAGHGEDFQAWKASIVEIGMQAASELEAAQFIQDDHEISNVLVAI